MWTTIFHSNNQMNGITDAQAIVVLHMIEWMNECRWWYVLDDFFQVVIQIGNFFIDIYRENY